MALAPVLPDELFSDAVRATEQLSWAPGRGYVLATLAPRLPVALVQKALAIAEALEADYEQLECLAALLPRLAEVGEPAAALMAAQGIEDRFWQERTLAAIAPYIAERVAPQEGLALARAIESSWTRLVALSGLVGVLPEPYRRTAIEEALAAAQDELVRAILARGNADRSAVVELALRFGQDGSHREALLLARTLPQQDTYGHQPRVDVLAQLLPAASD